MKATIETRAGVRCIVGASGGVLPADIYHVAFFKEAKRLRAEAERLSMELTNYKLGFATQTEAREAADAEVERLSARTCIHHTDAERAAAGCPVCARADADDQARWAKHYLDRAEAAERALISMTADRDSWCDQADQRATDAVTALTRAEAAEAVLTECKRLLVTLRPRTLVVYRDTANGNGLAETGLTREIDAALAQGGAK